MRKKSDFGQLIDKFDKTEFELWLLESARTTAELMARIEEQQELLEAITGENDKCLNIQRM